MTSAEIVSSSFLRVLMKVLFTFLPVLAYGASVAISVATEGTIHFRALDLIVLFLVIGYAGVAIFVHTFRQGRFFSRFLLLSGSSLLTLALVEAGLRLFYPLPPPSLPWTPRHLLWKAGDQMPGITGDIEFSVNELGLRGPNVRLRDQDLRILCVGGSTTECLYVTDQKSWPWLVQDSLAQLLGKRVFVGNSGKSGHITLNHLYLLQHYPPVRQFEWVIVFAGINDMGALVNRGHYEYFRDRVAETLTPMFRNEANYRKLALLRLVHSAWSARQSGATVVQDPSGDWYREARRKRQAALKKKTFSEMPTGLESALATYDANLVAIIQACRENRQQLLMMTQPTLYRKDLPEDLELLLWSCSDEGAYTPEILEKLMDAFNQRMREVCRREGTDCLDLASLLPQDTSVFFDDCHFNLAGCERVAAAVVEFLKKRLQHER